VKPQKLKHALQTRFLELMAILVGINGINAERSIKN
jgi:hypothetical protein